MSADVKVISKQHADSTLNMTSYYTTHSWRDSIKQSMFEIAQEVGNPMDYLL